MWPVLFKIGDFKIGTYGLMVAIGFFSAYLVGMKRAREAGLQEERFANFVIVTLIAGVIGAKLLFAVVYFHQAPLTRLLFSRSGLVFYGGLLTGIPTGWWMTKRNGWNPTEIADVVAPLIPLGHFFGRIGCFLNGCCYGKVCEHWYGIRFPRLMENGHIVGSEPYLDHLDKMLVTAKDVHSLPVYPTQIISSLGQLAIFLFLYFYMSKRTRFKGQLALVYLLLYSTFRFCVEILRDDPRGQWPGGLSTSQGISIGIALFALVMWPILKKRSRESSPESGGPK